MDEIHLLHQVQGYRYSVGGTSLCAGRSGPHRYLRRSRQGLIEESHMNVTEKVTFYIQTLFGWASNIIWTHLSISVPVIYMQQTLNA